MSHQPGSKERGPVGASGAPERDRARPAEGLRVLLVEDNPGDAELVRQALAAARAGATVACVERISEALERAREGEWDAVLLDLSLPDAHGLSGAQRLHEAFPRLPIVVLTSLEDDRMAARAVAEGAQDYLLKGQLDPSLLLRSIRYAIQRQQYADERAARLAAETAQRRALLLSEVSGAAFGPLEDDASLGAVARVLVRSFADWCLIELAEGASDTRLTASAHVDPQKDGLLRALGDGAPEGEAALPGTGSVLRSGRPEVYPDIPEASLAAWARDGEHLELLRQVGLRSALVIPLGGRGRIFGAMTLALVGQRRYGADDLALAEEVAGRVATAIDNARLYREAQRAVRIREDVLAVVSHDLKTPLCTVQLAASSSLRALDRGHEGESLRGSLERIQRATSSANVLLDDLLDMASIRAGRLAIRTEREDAEALIAEAMQAHEALAREKGIALASRGATAEVCCDRNRALQVLSNVIANAIHACASGDRIELAVDAGERFATFTVADSGPGITEDLLPLVFEAYWSSAKHRRHGTGLGLFISKGIVEAQGGRIWIESRVGEGTKVSFTIPVDGASPAPPAQ